MPIKKFWIEYDSINSRNTFTNGDVMNGRIIVKASKKTKIQSLDFIAKGTAQVVISEYYGQNDRRVYVATEKYFEVTHHILSDARRDGTEIIGKGTHAFPFMFRIPEGRIPSSLDSPPGKIIYKVKAKLHQSMKKTKTAKVDFSFVSKADMGIPNLLDPLYGHKDKNIKVFGSGRVSLDVHINKMGYRQGETLQIIAEIVNNASRKVKPKFLLYETKTFFAQGQRRVLTRNILKEKDEVVKASSGSKTVTKMITIPRELPASIMNCSIIKLEYRLKVFLDIKHTPNPEVILPIVILPAISDERGPSAADSFGPVSYGKSKYKSRTTRPKHGFVGPRPPGPMCVPGPRCR